MSLPRPSLSLSRNAGSILIFTIWVIVFFAILSLGLYNIISSQIRLIKAAEDRFYGLNMAYAAYIYAKNQIKKEKSSYNTLYELRKKQEMQLGIGKFSYTLVDESSKININTASLDVISRLPGLDAELTKGICASSLKPFNNKEELLLIDGISEELYNKFKDFITVCSHGGVNINTAPLEVMTALGCDEELVSIIDNFRKGADAEEATKDDQEFKDSGEIVSALDSFRGLSDMQKEVLSQLTGQGLIGAEPSSFSLQIETWILSKAAMKYVIIIDGEIIKQWKEY